jgi:hypothetical protein
MNIRREPTFQRWASISVRASLPNFKDVLFARRLLSATCQLPLATRPPTIVWLPLLFSHKLGARDNNEIPSAAKTALLTKLVIHGLA